MNHEPSTKSTPYFCHPSSYVDDGAIIGSGTKIWHFSHIQKGAKIGERCIFGQNVNVADGVIIGNNVKVQNNVSIYTGTVIEDDVFLGPSCVLTNVTNPRSQINRHSLYEKTLIRRGATIGANATIVCGVTLGRYCFIAAGSVVTKDVPDYALMVGNPARQKGWMSRHGHILKPETLNLAPETLNLAPETLNLKPETLNLKPETLNLKPETLHLAPETSLSPSPLFICPESGFRYQIVQSETLNLAPETSPSPSLRCLDLDEEAPLPPELTQGTKTYDELKC